MTNQNLHDALLSFRLGKAFLHRLARENGWSLDYARRASLEYKRFVYMAMVSPDPVTPSAAVDQVWHLHMIDTRSYWEDLCEGLLGRPLHHGPTAGGQAEDQKYKDWYERTRDLYKSEFGELPPIDLWPPGTARFDKAQRLRWLDISRHWVIPKPSWNLLGRSPSVLALFVAGPNSTLPLVMIGGTIALLLIFFSCVASTNQRRNKRDPQDAALDGSYFGDSSDSDCHDTGSCGDSASSGCSSGCAGGGCGGGGD